MRLLRLFLAVTILATLVSAASGAAAQEPDTNFTINLDARDVSVSVSVTDLQGRPVTKLTKDDFLVFEDGVQQQIQTFESVDAPYNVMVLVDCSTSTEADWPLMGDAIDRFASKLRPVDKIAVAQFGGKTEVLLDWQTKKGNSLGVKIQPTRPSCAGTDFYGAVEDAAARLKNVTGRHGVVVLTDGVQTTPPVPFQNLMVGAQRVQRVSNSADDKDFQRALKTVAKSDVVFYFVAVNTDLNPDQAGGAYQNARNRYGPNGIYDPRHIYDMQQWRLRMQLLAEKTGGRMAFPKRPADVVSLYEEIAVELGTSYGLSYSPKKVPGPNDTRPRKIEVRMKSGSMIAKANRDSYTPLAK